MSVVEKLKPGEVCGGFNVKKLAGCRLVFGEIPVSELEMLTHGYTSAALMDSRIAADVGATLVIGEPRDLAALGKMGLSRESFSS